MNTKMREIYIEELEEANEQLREQIIIWEINDKLNKQKFLRYKEYVYKAYGNGKILPDPADLYD